jgi:hypothetical protein
MKQPRKAKNHGAEKRARQKRERRRQREAAEAGRGRAQATGRPSARFGGIQLDNCKFIGGGTGIVLGPGANVRASRIHMKDMQIGIDNQGGYFDGPDTVIE